MEHKLILFGIVLAFLSSSCKTPAYLPEAEEIDINEYGSYINVDLFEGSDIEGELIAIESDALIVLEREKESNQLQTVSTAEIESFKLRYAQPANYGWRIPVYGLGTLSHGFWALFTLPANIVATSIITARGKRAFTYNEEDMTWEKLTMFARFPQGLPTHVNLADIE